MPLFAPVMSTLLFASEGMSAACHFLLIGIGRCEGEFKMRSISPADFGRDFYLAGAISSGKESLFILGKSECSRL
jgi:hypothetical protein